MADANTVREAEGALAERLLTYLSEKLGFGHLGIAGLQWSPRMPADEPNADLLVIFPDDDAIDYVLEVDVTLWRYRRVETVELPPDPPPL